MEPFRIITTPKSSPPCAHPRVDHPRGMDDHDHALPCGQARSAGSVGCRRPRRIYLPRLKEQLSGRPRPMQTSVCRRCLGLSIFHGFIRTTAIWPAHEVSVWPRRDRHRGRFGSLRIGGREQRLGCPEWRSITFWHLSGPLDTGQRYDVIHSARCADERRFRDDAKH